VVVWNLTRACELKCRHCYARAGRPSPGELTTQEALQLIDQIAALGARILIFSGGEPLLRPDIYTLLQRATARGLKTLVSTNGVGIDERMAEGLKRAGTTYVGVSFDGLGTVHDRIRGVKGAFDRALAALKVLNAVGVMTGVRFTLWRANLDQLEPLLDLLEELGVRRFCLYHLVYSGRAADLMGEDLTPQERRVVVGYLIERALEWRDGEIETVASPVDGVYAYRWLKEWDPSAAERAASYLMARGGDPSAERLISIDELGRVHPNQFWWDYTLGSVKEAPLGVIWARNDDPLLKGLRSKPTRVKGRCGRCAFRQVCAGFRLRALRVYGDPWAEDPACYLGEEEVVAW
jgi:radical SAM protein with 4Fe4S-binding SPASM domain